MFVSFSIHSFSLHFCFLLDFFDFCASGNHSCRPNAEVKFPNNNFTLHVVALRDIQPGEEICISYLEECMLSSSKNHRNEYLRFVRDSVRFFASTRM
jgi:hypothetical protein